MAKIKSYQDLTVWQKSIDLAQEIYIATRKFPKEEIYGITSQMRSAAVSIASNIAEGQARNSTGEFRQFLGIARGSLAELETQLVLAKRLTLLTDPIADKLLDHCAEISKLLTGLLKSLPTNH